LRNFELGGVGAVVGEGSVAHSALMEHLTECFVACEAEIARLNKCVRKLKKKNANLKAGEHVEAAIKESLGGGGLLRWACGSNERCAGILLILSVPS
jgi:hypothetical protein